MRPRANRGYPTTFPPLLLAAAERSGALQTVQPRRGHTPHGRTGARHRYVTHDESSRNSAIPLAVPHPRRRTGARHGYAGVTSASRIRYERPSALSALMRPKTRAAALAARVAAPRNVGPAPHGRTGARHRYETHDESSRNSAIPLAMPHPRRRTGARHGYAGVTNASRIRVQRPRASDHGSRSEAGSSRLTAARRRNA
jgi:hypothetical protein